MASDSLFLMKDLGPGSHLCWIYETEEEHQAVLRPFLHRGLELGEKVLYIADTRADKVIMGYLQADGLDGESYVTSGQLSILSAKDAYVRNGVFDPDDMIGLLRMESERALVEGYPALRVTGEMSWALQGLPGSERLIEYEAKLSEFFPGSKCLTICQYDRRRFPPALLLDVLTTHPIAVFGAQLYANFYYIPPSEFLSGDPSAAKLRHCLDNLAEHKRIDDALRKAHDELERWVEERTIEVMTANEQLKREIKERKQAEAALQEREAEYRELVQSANSIILRFDTQGRITFFNEFAQGFFGYSEDEIVGQNIVGTIVPVTDASGHDLAAMIKDLLKHPEQYINNENENIRRNGERVWVAWTNRAVLDDDGRIVEILSIGNDITSHRGAEKALRESEERYRSFVQNFQGIAFRGKMDFTPIFFHGAVEGITGYKADEFTSGKLKWNQIIYQDDLPLLSESIKRLTSSPDYSDEREYRIVRKDGEIRWVREVVQNICDTSGKPEFVQGVIYDITERKRLDERLLWSQKMETLGRLAGGVAHDFNNLLATIQGNTELAMMEPYLPGRVKNDLREVLKASKRSAELTQQLLAFSRRQVIEPRVLNLNEVLQNADAMLRRLIGEDIELVTRPAQDLGRTKVDPTQIEQVIVNIAVNARHAMPEGGKLTLETANVTLDQDYGRQHTGVSPGEYVILAISDTGVGMTEEVKAHLFEPFFTTKEMGKGTGLGLATCYGIVKESGGNIWVYGEPGKGTTFKIYLPRVAEDVEALPRNDEEGYLRAGTETVLLVEDETPVRDVTARMLRGHGYTVLEAATGDEALRVASEHGGKKIHLLLTDVVMPQMSGEVLASKLKAERPDIRVIFFSGYPGEAIAQHGVLDGGVAFLEKPFSPSALASKVRAVLDR